MSHRIIAFLLLVLFATQSFQQNLLVLDYAANMVAYIEACINKAKPGLKCQGKCQLAKKLQESEKKEQQNTGHKGDNQGPTFYAAQHATFILPTPNRQATVYPPLTVPQTTDRAHAVFHPPALM